MEGCVASVEGWFGMGGTHDGQGKIHESVGVFLTGYGIEVARLDGEAIGPAGIVADEITTEEHANAVAVGMHQIASVLEAGSSDSLQAPG